jgi:hypothetical protein
MKHLAFFIVIHGFTFTLNAQANTLSSSSEIKSSQSAATTAKKLSSSSSTPSARPVFKKKTKYVQRKENYEVAPKKD